MLHVFCMLILAESLRSYRYQSGEYSRIRFQTAQKQFFYLTQTQRGNELSDFHEMATNLRMKKERFLPAENPANGIDDIGRRWSAKKRQFSNSHYFQKKNFGSNCMVIPERRCKIRDALHPLQLLQRIINKIYSYRTGKHSKSENLTRIESRTA